MKLSSKPHVPIHIGGQIVLDTAQVAHWLEWLRKDRLTSGVQILQYKMAAGLLGGTV
jgi:hypothetical protein